MGEHGLTRYSAAILIALAILLAVGISQAVSAGHGSGNGSSLTIPADDYNGPPVR